MVLKQTFKNHFIIFEFSLSITILFFIGWWYFEFDRDYLLVVGIFHLLFTIPSLYLHIEYSIRNSGEEIEINPNEIIVRKNGQEKRYSISDLAKIIVYKSASLDKWGMPLTAMEYYRYARLMVKNGEEIIITCLMSRKVDEEVRKLSGVPYARKKGFFCTLSWK